MKKRTVILLGFIVVKFLLQYALVNPVYELHRDEFLHLDQGKHLAFGYVSVPPFTAWVSWLIQILGNGEFWIRFFPALFGATTLWLVWKTVEGLGGGLFALSLSAVACLFSVLLRLNILYQPNSMDVLCWVFIYFCVIKFASTHSGKWIWFAALGFAIGFLNKYNIVFCILGLLPALVLTEHRSIFLRKELYGATAIALFLILPNIWWQYAHGFPVFSHLRELTNTQLVNVSRSSFLKEQIIYFIGSIYVIIAGLVSLLIYAPFRKYLVILYAILFSLCIFIFFRAKAYYAIGLYPILLSFGSVYLAHLSGAGWKKWLRPVMLLIPLLIFLPIAKLAFPLSTPAHVHANPDAFRDLGMLKWEDGKDHALPQDFADMQGWKELAAIVDSVYAAIPDPQHTLVRTDNYGQAGAINFYSRENVNALSYNADYIYWFPTNIQWKNMIMVKDADDEDPSRSREKLFFDSVYLAGKIKNPYAREIGTAVYVLLGAKPGLTDTLRREIIERQHRD